MTTVQRRPLGSILWREQRQAFEVRVRERRGEPQRSTYVAGPNTPARREAAERKRAELVAAAGRGERQAPRTLTVGRWLDQWLEMHAGLRPGTVRAYGDRIELYLKPHLGRRLLADLEPLDVQRAFARIAERPGRRGETLSVSTVDAAYRTLHAALEDAVRAGKATRNAASAVRLARPDVQIEPPTLAELDALFAELAGDIYAPILELMRWTGARRGEALGLQWRDVNHGAGTVTYRRQASGALKTRSSVRTVAPPARVMAMLAGIPRRLDSPLLFTTSTGQPIDPRNLVRHYDAALERAGIAPSSHADLDKYRAHDLRHAFATLLLEAGVASPTVGAWLGHKSLAMLDRYAHVRPVAGGEAYARIVAEWGPDAGAAFGLHGARQAAAR